MNVNRFSQEVFYLALLRLKGVGPAKSHHGLTLLSSPQKIFESNSTILEGIGFSKKAIVQCGEVLNFYRDHQTGNFFTDTRNVLITGIQQDLKWKAAHKEHHLLTWEDEDYPERLKNIHHPPLVLFVKGNQTILKCSQLAMVGSRRPSAEGKRNAVQFAKSVVDAGLVVTSGLAHGIDSASHIGALRSHTSAPKTIAILAHGLDIIYPKSNIALADQIVKSGGALVSEFPIGVGPRPEYFPKRNRIISGLALGVLVVEAAVKSGSLITAYSALEQNREVFAVPGSIHNPMSKGCHQLIRHGAKLVEKTSDILEELPPLEIETEPKLDPELEPQSGSSIERLDQDLKTPSVRPAALNEGNLETKLIKGIEHQEVSLNELALIVASPVAEVAAALMNLELKGVVELGPLGYSLCSEIEI